MGRKRTPGLYKRYGQWQIDKKVQGTRLCESTGTCDLEEAESYLARRIEQIRQARVFGIRASHTFAEAATKYLIENQHKASIVDDAMHLKQLHSFIGYFQLVQICNDTLQAFIQARNMQGVKNKTINLALGVVRRILNLAASEWQDETGLTWLHQAPKLKMLPLSDARKPYPLSCAELNLLLSNLPEHLANMVKFKANTGCREKEVCMLQWDWEYEVPDLGASIFIIPGKFVKNRRDRLVVLNNTASQVVEDCRGQHPQYVFTYKGKPIQKINNTAWKRVRKQAGLAQVRVHDLKHTFGRRLRAAGVSFEDRQDLLGHSSSRITTHYSAAELSNLIDAVNKVSLEASHSLTVIRKKSEMGSVSRGSPVQTSVGLKVLQGSACK